MNNTKKLNHIIDYQPVKTTIDIVYKKTLIKSSIKKNCINYVYMCDICHSEPATENIDKHEGLDKECWFCWNY
jgi:hypothetical protein